MGRICEHEFEKEDPKNSGYSLTEYDLNAKLGLTIRKDINNGYYEIATIAKPRIVKYVSKDLNEITRIANKLEGEKNTTVECGALCPKRRK